MVYLSFALLAFAAFLQVRHGLYIERLRASFEQEREWWQEERVSLLNRIQAPEVAVAQSQPEPTEQPLHLPVDDTPFADESWDAFLEDAS